MESPPAWSLDGAAGGIASNPAAVDPFTGTGRLGRALGFGPDSGVRLGGALIGDANYLAAGGVEPESWAFDGLFMLDLGLDLDKLFGIPSAQFAAEFLQFNGQDMNAEAGSLTGYNSLSGLPPFDRSELYELWWRQGLFDDKLVLRIGKSTATVDFNNVVAPLNTSDESLVIPAVTSLIYTPIFKNPTMIGAMPGFYNPAYGIIATLVPADNSYVSVAAYDGNLARGVQTGLELLPEFNGYYFTIGEVGHAWTRGPFDAPGIVAFGVWRQTGELSADGSDGTLVTDDGAQGFYMFGSQRVWQRNPGVDNSGVSVFFQFGANASDTLLVNTYYGAGFTGFGLVPGRPNDSIGVGMAFSKLNPRLGFNDEEILLAVYYQLQLPADISIQPTLTYIPEPGLSADVAPALALTLHLVSLF